jgi:hypothetical protein
VKVWSGPHWLRISSSGGYCEHGNELSSSVKGGKVIDQLSKYQLLSKDYAQWSYLWLFRDASALQLHAPPVLSRDAYKYRSVVCPL